MRDCKLLIACSGGLDSVVLSFLCHRLQLSYAIAHCNFSLRGKESDEDELFVKKIAESMGASFFSKSFNTKEYAKSHKVSTQMAARELRYSWFSELVNYEDFEYVLTAHHLDDSLESFLINVSRGTGIEGLIGIPEINGNIVRPLLIFSRADIKNYAKEHSILWREDKTNAESNYLRNRLRHQVIPNLKAVNSNFLKNFQKTICHLKNTNSFVVEEMLDIKQALFNYKESGYIEIEIAALEKYLDSEFYMYEVFREFGFTSGKELLKLVAAQSGKQLFSSSHRLLKDRDTLLLSKLFEEVSASTYHITEDESMQMIASGMLKFKQVAAISDTNLRTIYVDKETLKYPLTVRRWKEGDYFYPLGMMGKKKLSKYFKDEKLSLLAKENVWVLCSEEAIVWIINYRADERFKITKNTKKLLKVTLSP